MNLKELALNAYKKEMEAYQAQLLAKAEEDRKRREKLKQRVIDLYGKKLNEIFGVDLPWTVKELDETSEVPRWARLTNGDLEITVNDDGIRYNGKVVTSLAQLGKLIKDEQNARESYSRYDFPA